MALALYRKYRPATFAEVVGQEHVTEPLRTALAANRINHAYLFSGPRGCGKTSSARILARSLNCAQGPTPDPCDECDSCVSLAPEGGGSVDVVELDAASHGGVDDTRELRDRAFFAPAQSRYRIFVIDEAHMVTTQGFNALLKIVEEPPEHLIFVFATTEPDKVLTTIRSRTHHYPFRLMPPGVLRDLLERICGDEGVHVEPVVYPLVIRAGGGSARDTLSVLDQLLAGAGEGGITYERAVALLGVTDVALIDDMLDALAADDGGTVYGTIDRVVEAGHDPRRFGSDLLDRLRDLVLLQAVPDAAQRGLLHASGDELTKMQNQAEQLGAATLSRFAEIVHTGLSDMRGATAPRLLLELLCARMLLPAISDSETALLQRLERVERRMTIAAPSEETTAMSAAEPGEAPVRRVFRRPHERAASEPSAEQPAAAASPRPEVAEPAQPTQPTQSAQSAQSVRSARSAQSAQSAETAEPAQSTEVVQPAQAAQPAEAVQPMGPPQGGGLDAAGVRRVWTELLRAVTERNRPTQALLLNATVQDLRDGVLVLSMPTSGLVKQLAQQHRLDFVREAMRAVVGGEWDVRCVEAGANAAAPSAPAPSGGATRGAPARSAQRREPPRGDEQQRPAAAAHDQGEERQPEKQQPARSATPPSPDEPPPPEPPDEEQPEEVSPVGDEDEETILAESSPASPDMPRRDSEDVAVELLTSELGARKID